MFKKKSIFVFLGLLCSILLALPLAMQGGFEDSLIYYSQADYIWSYGLYDGLRAIYIQTNKFEPAIGLLFFIEGFLVTEKFYFLLLNLTLVNFITVLIYVKINEESNTSISFIYAILLLSTYYIFSNNIYVWRTIISLYFFILFVFSESKSCKVIFFSLGFLFHYSFLLFYFCYIICKFNKSSLKFFLIYAFLFSLFISNALNFLSYFSFFVSGGELTIFLDKGSDSIKRIIIGVSFLIILIMVKVDKKSYSWSLYKLSLFFCILSIALYQNWQLSWRIFVPAATLGSAIVLANIRKDNIIPFLGVVLSTIPTMRIIYNLLYLGHP
ncbi:polymerase [Salmonella enterica]|nr:polymerase [Salmonella enterica]